MHFSIIMTETIVNVIKRLLRNLNDEQDRYGVKKWERYAGRNQ